MLEAHLSMNGERVKVVIGKRELNAAELRWEARSIKPALVRFMKLNSSRRNKISNSKIDINWSNQQLINENFSSSRF